MNCCEGLWLALVIGWGGVPEGVSYLINCYTAIKIQVTEENGRCSLKLGESEGESLTVIGNASD